MTAPLSPYVLIAIVDVAEAEAASAEVYRVCPDAGPGNFCVPLVPADGDDDAAPTYMMFAQAITEAHRTELVANNVHRWPTLRYWLTDRSGVLLMRWDAESPEPVQFVVDDALAETGLKRRVVAMDLSGE